MAYSLKVKVKMFAFREITRFQACVTLNLDHKVISAILNLHFNQHIISSYCAKYKHTSSMHERGVCIMSSVANFKNNLTLIFDFKVISIF